MEFSLNDFEQVDEQAVINTQVQEIKNRIGQLRAQLYFPAKLRSAVGLGGIAAAYTGSFIPTILAGVMGWKLGNGRQLTEVDKQVIANKIKALEYQLQRLEAGERAEEAKSTGIMSSYDLQNYTYKNYPFDGQWEELMGKPSVPFAAMVFGRPKNGKSIFCTQFAKYLSENFGPTLYCSAEEGFSYTLQKKLNEFGMTNQNLYFANYRDFESIKNALDQNPFRFVFIDSVNFMKLTPEQVEELKALNPETSFITVQQATKGGQFRGSQEYAHNCDIIIEVIAGVAHHQGRFQDAGTTYEIFAKEQTPEGPGEEIGQLELFSDL